MDQSTASDQLERLSREFERLFNSLSRPSFFPFTSAGKVTFPGAITNLVIDLIRSRLSAQQNAHFYILPLWNI